MTGTIVSHYEILEKLGEGGMGVVYKAEDMRLGRSVALKFLPPHLSSDAAAAERFIHEAKAASALDHPNICTVYDIGHTPDDRLFIVMAFYEGQTLRYRLKEGAFPIAKALDTAIQITEGVARAHEAGIVHRDIKPANLMLTDRGRVKILDFGLAKVADMNLTKTGTAVGTVPYMSPEQARGGTVDARTDVWSLGVVLYEMLTGRRPFEGDYEQAVVYAILNMDPVPIQQLRSDLPEALGPIVERLLQKEPDARYQQAEEVLVGLASIGSERDPARQNGGPPAGSRIIQDNSIGVLPFVNMSSDPEQEYFSDGLTEEIITDLSQLEKLLVISRSSMMTFKGSGKKTKEIAHEVNVRYILEGSVRKAGNHLRITAQLIDSQNDNQIWAEKYKGTIEDIFDIQESVSRSIVESLEIQLTSKEESELAHHTIQDPRSRDYFMRARHEMLKLTETGLLKAIKIAEQGLELVEENAQLYATLSLANLYLHHYGFRLTSIQVEKAKTQANQSLALDPECPTAHLVLGFFAFYIEYDKQAAVRIFKKVLEYDKNNPDALRWLATTYLIVDKNDLARSMSIKLLQLDPVTSETHGLRAWVEMYTGLFQEAIPYFEKWLQMDPDAPFTLYWSSLFYAGNHQYDKSIDLLDALIDKFPDSIYEKFALFFRSALKGDREDALRYATEELKVNGEALDWLSVGLALGYAIISEKDEAVKWCEIMLNQDLIMYTYFNAVDVFRNLKDHPGFQAFMSEVKRRSDAFDV